jgi:hypothetical protein
LHGASIITRSSVCGALCPRNFELVSYGIRVFAMTQMEGQCCEVAAEIRYCLSISVVW